MAKKTAEQRFWEKVDKSNPNGCWIWIGTKNKEGRGHISINGRTVTAGRYVWELTHGPIPDGLCVCHNCPNGDDVSCVNPAHLWLGTHSENMADRDRKGRRVPLRGEKCSQAKLTAQQVAEIRQRYAFRGIGGESGRVLSKLFGVSQTEIYKIVTGKKWIFEPPAEINLSCGGKDDENLYPFALAIQSA